MYGLGVGMHVWAGVGMGVVIGVSHGYRDGCMGCM